MGGSGSKVSEEVKNALPKSEEPKGKNNGADLPKVEEESIEDSSKNETPSENEKNSEQQADLRRAVSSPKRVREEVEDEDAKQCTCRGCCCNPCECDPCRCDNTLTKEAGEKDTSKTQEDINDVPKEIAASEEPKSDDPPMPNGEQVEQDSKVCQCKDCPCSDKGSCQCGCQDGGKCQCSSDSKCNGEKDNQCPCDGKDCKAIGCDCGCQTKEGEVKADDANQPTPKSNIDSPIPALTIDECAPEEISNDVAVQE